MRRPYIIMIVAILSLVAPGVASASSGDTFAALKTEYETVVKSWISEHDAAYQAAKKQGDAAVKMLRFPKPHPRATYSPRFLAIAEANPTGPDALKAISATLLLSQRVTGKPLEIRTKAFKLLRQYYATSPNIGKLVNRLARDDGDDAKAFVNDVIDRNPDRAMQGKAYQAIANACEEKVSHASWLRKNAKAREHIEKREGKEEVAKQIADGDKAAQEAERINKILREKFADIVPDLSIGARMPALLSEDPEGKTRALDELKGKVVVLDVWATWCGPCKAMIPHEREMVKRLKDKPFALVSISADEEKKTLTDFLAKEPMPWNHWWNGAEGKLKDTLNIQHYPTIFVLDHEGVIRFKEIRGEELEKAVNTLLNEMKAKPGA